MENNAAEGLSLEALMGATLGDLPELNAVPPEGTYQVKVKLAIKEINKVSSIEATYLIQETIELVDSEVAPPKKDAKFTELFMSNNDLAMGRFKQVLSKICGHTGATTVAEAIQGGPYDAMLVLKHRKDKKDPSVVYANVVKLEMV